MKAQILIVAALFSMVFSSCKDEKGTPAAAPASTEIKPTFNVEVNAVTDKPDDVALYYNEDGTSNFVGGDQVMWRSLKPGVNEPLLFQLPENVVPKALRIDFGLKKKQEQGNVTLKSLKISGYSKNFEIKGSDFFNYFVKNEAIETQIDSAAGTITFKQNLKDDGTPFYYPQGSLIEELKKISN